MDLNPILFPAVTNRETFAPIIALNDDDTGDLIDLTDLTFEVELRRLGARTNDQSGYTPNYDYGGVNDYGPVLTASLGSGVTVLGTGTFQIVFTAAQMRTLVADTYSLACVISDGDTDRQLFLGRLPVLEGRVT